MAETKRRLVTRADFDGLVCAVLLRERDLISDISFVQPREMQSGQIEISDQDITTNLPYVEGVHLAFDHHASEIRRVGERSNLVIDPKAPSAARVVYDYYGGAKSFPRLSSEMLAAVDQADSAQYSEEDILAPTGWTLLNFIIDPRTGLSRFTHFKTSAHELMLDLVSHCLNPSISEILKIPDVEERVYFYLARAELAEHQLKSCTRLVGATAVVDLRDQAVMQPCNRFMVYGLFRAANLSIQVTPTPAGDMVELAMGHSILNRSSQVDVGRLMLSYGGGGLPQAGTCQVPAAEADRVLGELLERAAQLG